MQRATSTNEGVAQRLLTQALQAKKASQHTINTIVLPIRANARKTIK